MHLGSIHKDTGSRDGRIWLFIILFAYCSENPSSSLLFNSLKKVDIICSQNYHLFLIYFLRFLKVQSFSKIVCLMK